MPPNPLRHGFASFLPSFHPFLLLLGLSVVWSFPQGASYQSDNIRNRKKPIFSVLRETVEGIKGTKVTLGCRVTYDEKYMVVWYKQKRTLTFNSRRVTDDSRFTVATPTLFKDVWDLQIDPVQLSDEGDYDCIINTKPPTKKTVKLVVKVAPHLNFKPWNGERVLKEGSTIRLPCVATGKPLPNVTWYRDWKDKPKQKIGTFDFESDIFVQGTSLQFVRVTRDMEGSYVCIARNGVYPNAKQWVVITVQFPPQVTMVNSKIGQRRGELTILQCRVWGNPVGEVSWEFNGKPLQGVTTCHTHMDYAKFCEDVSKPLEDSRRISVDLTIRNISTSDYGEYTCISASTMGVGRASTILHEVIDPDENRRYRIAKKKHLVVNRGDDFRIEDGDRFSISGPKTDAPLPEEREKTFVDSWTAVERTKSNRNGVPLSSVPSPLLLSFFLWPVFFNEFGAYLR